MHFLRLRKARTVGLSAVLVLALIGIWAPRTADAVTVTVGDFFYDLTVLTPGQSFNAANAASGLTATPWWGDGDLANDVADAYALVASPLAAPVRFAFSAPFGLVVASYEAASGAAAFDLGLAFTTGGSAFVTGTRRPIPEIDGAVVPRLALMVLAAYLVVLTLRRNRAMPVTGGLQSAGAALAVRLPVRPFAKAKHMHADQEIGHGMRGDRIRQGAAPQVESPEGDPGDRPGQDLRMQQAEGQRGYQKRQRR